jgi:cytochrome c-type biogenesis protein CcmE
MKKSHILAIVVIGIAIAIMISTAGDTSSYVNFTEAKSIAVKNSSDVKVHVVGTLRKDAQGQAMDIYPSADKLSFSFILLDDQNTPQEVYYNEPMPADFQRSEQVVIIGSYQKEVFVADKILLKCPSKYQEEEIKAS